MGTTQPISPGVTGQPNWKNLKAAISGVANTVAQEKNLPTLAPNEVIPPSDDQDIGVPPTVGPTEREKILKRRDKRIQSAYSGLIRSGGGKTSIRTGGSKSIGRSGRSAARRLAGFFTYVSQNGLAQALSQTGFGQLQGRTVSEILDHLETFCVESNAGMDETAASNAIREVLKEFAIDAGESIENFEDAIRNAVDSSGLASLLCKFWGIYIFEHLAQRFSEAVSQKKGAEISEETFAIIRTDILGRVQNLNDVRPVTQIDWSGQEGIDEIERIFGNILDIICDEN